MTSHHSFWPAAFPVVVALFASSTASACPISAPFVIEDVRLADTVVVGQVADYEFFAPDGPHRLSTYGVMTVRVSRVLRGSPGHEIRAYRGSNGASGAPPSMAFGQPRIFAFVNAGGTRPPVRTGAATILASQEPELPQLLQAPCATPFIIRQTPQAERNIELILAGRSPLAISYDTSERAVWTDPSLAPALQRGWPTWIMIGFGMLTAACVALVVTAIWQSRRPTNGDQLHDG
jgi:hypothetical protein